MSHLINLVTGEDLNHPKSCRCAPCERARLFTMLDILRSHYNRKPANVLVMRKEGDSQ